LTPSASSFEVARLGEARLRTPLATSYVDDRERLLFPSTLSDVQRCAEAGETPPSFEIAGPRERIFFDPRELRCGIVTCGGLCPGLNDVVRAVVLSLHHHYGVRTVAVSERKRIDPAGRIWNHVLAATGQPRAM
jgi:6-phosphofructokinase 1